MTERSVAPILIFVNPKGLLDDIFGVELSLLVRYRAVATKATLAVSGRKVETIGVELSYQIIKHFSAGLYTSPNKAVEELVSNSYDAFAYNVHVIVPDNLSAPEATIWVVDDGESMDVQGFRDLWKIGESTKRDPRRESKKRPPIGKFGIGKLATYVLAKGLTYVCKHDGKYRVVTMDFSILEKKRGLKKLRLNVRAVTEADAQEIVAPAAKWDSEKDLFPKLFGKKAAKTWTVAAMTDLSPMARQLTVGRLKHVLRTALPLNPEFNLFFNGERLEPQKIDLTRIQTWIIGKDDEVAKELDYKTGKTPDGKPFVEIPGLGEISGTSEIFEDALPTGKSEDWGRSNGFFVMVRERLINQHDELFSMEALSHGAFSRFRMVVNAKGLDEHLRATREAVAADEEGVRNFREYLRAKFNEARGRYATWMTEQATEKSLSSRISRTPASFSRQPLARAIQRVLDGKLDRLMFTRIPVGMDAAKKEALVKDLEKSLGADDFFTAVRFETLGVEEGLAIFDVEERCFKVNMLHPFFANFADHSRGHEAFQLLAITEVLTEAYLFEEEFTADQVRHIMVQRDRFLRALVFSTQLSAPLVAQLLDDSKANPKGLEKAVGEGMRSLSFEVSPMGKNGEPDGLALARLGVRDATSGKSETYTVTYEAKSSKNERVSAKDVDAAAVKKHRTDTKADYTVVVARGFEGGDDDDSNVVKHAREHEFTLIELDDFMKLVLLASTRPLGLHRLRDEFFVKCRSALESRTWVNGLLSEHVPGTNLPEILSAIWAMQNDSPDPPRFPAIRERLALQDAKKFKTIRAQDVKDLMMSVSRFSGELVYISGDQVSLNALPERILAQIQDNASKLPEAIRKSSMYAAINPGKADGKK